MALNPFDVTINGQGLSDYGIFGLNLDGLGLSTYGFVWLCSSVWDTAQPDGTCTWIDCPNPNPNVESCDD